MSGIATAVVGGAVIGGIASNQAAGKAADASTSAANTAAQADREALEYMKQTEAIPQQFREGALQSIGGAYGLSGGTGSQQDLINRAQSSPLYSAIMGGQQAGEDAILRNASATGGLRSGNVQGALTDYGSQLHNQALLEAYNQQMMGLSGLAQLPSNVNAIAQQQSGIGETLAAGQIAAGQAQQAGIQGVGNSITGGIDNYLAAKNAGLL